MIKFLFIINLLFSTVFALDCNQLIISRENPIELKVLIDKFYYKATLEISGSPDKDSKNHEFKSGSELKIGSNVFVAKSCYTKDTKSFIIIELMPKNNVEVEFNSLDFEAKNSSDLKKEEIINFLRPKVPTGSSLFKTSKRKTDMQVRKRPTTSDSYSNDDESDLQPPPIKKSNSSSQIDEGEEMHDTKLHRDLEDIESEEYQSTSLAYKKTDNQIICKIIFENGSGTYTFIDSSTKSTRSIYVYLFDTIKHWYHTDGYLLDHTNQTPDNITNAHENVLKSCHDIIGKTDASLEYLTRSGHLKKFYATSITSIVLDVIGHHKFKLHSSDLDEAGVYSFYDENKVLIGEATLKNPYSITEEFTDPNNSSISIHYEESSLVNKQNNASHRLISIKLKHKDNDNYYDKKLKISTKIRLSSIIPFKSFDKLKDESDRLFKKDEKKSHLSDSKIYNKDIQDIIKKLQLPNFEKINFCDLLFFPGEYQVKFKSSSTVYLQVTHLRNILYDSQTKETTYSFGSKPKFNSCVYSVSGSKIDNKKDFIHSVEVLSYEEYFLNNDLKVFIESNNQCLNLISPGSYKIYQPFGFPTNPEINIDGIKKIEYSFTLNKVGGKTELKKCILKE